jgi:hypothetical protein
MKSLVIVSLFSFSTSIAVAQQQVINVDKDDYNAAHFFQTVSGQPVLTAKFVRLSEGTPYFSDNWLKATITSLQGTVYKGIRVKLDLTDGKLHYLDAKGNEFISSTPIKELVLTDSINNKDFRFISSSGAPYLKEGWYLSLIDGDATLYKVFQKSVREDKPYGSAVTEQRIVTLQKFVLVYNGQAHNIKNTKELPSILSNKKPEMEAFIKAQNSKASTEEKLAAAITYYNSLAVK